MEASPTPRWPDWLPYVAPLGAFLILTAGEGYLPGSESSGPDPFWYPVGYALKVVIVTVVAWLCRSTWRDLKPWPGPNWLALSVGSGLLVAVLWVGLDGLYPQFAFLGSRSAFNPMEGMSSGGRAAFLSVRFFGLVLLVPLIEELFWRSFLMRWIIDPDFTKVPIGRVTLVAAVVTSALFASAHPEWLPALLTGLIWAALLKWSGSVSACLVSHAAANLALGLYVVVTGDWKYL